METWQLPGSPMDSAVWTLDILMEYHEKSVWKVSLMECHEEFVGGICTLVTMWENRNIRGSVENLYSTNETGGCCESEQRTL